MNKKLKEAIRRDKTLTADMFDRSVSVTHQDGSHFFIQHAKVKIEKDWLTVWNEHGSPMVFDRSDLASFRVLEDK